MGLEGRKCCAQIVCNLPALKRLLCQDVEGQLVRFAVEVFVQGVSWRGCCRWQQSETRSCRTGISGCRIGKDFFSAVPLYIQDKLRTFSESVTQDWVLQINLGLVK